MKPEQAARALAWFSIGLGVAELLAPRRVGKAIGIRGHRTLLRVFGLREIGSGVGILSRKDPAPWVWSRVAGDFLDLLCLGAALKSPGTKKARLMMTATAVMGATVADALCGRQLHEHGGSGNGARSAQRGAIQVRKSITIGRSREDLYAFWRRLENLPQIMAHLDAVRMQGDKMSRWTAKGPMGTTVEWDAEIVEDRPSEVIGWRSLPGGTVDTWGNVRFEQAPGERGTIVRVDLCYRPPVGSVGAAIAKLFGEAPEQQIAEDLRRFKQLMEAGEIATTQGQPAGRKKSATQHEHIVRKWAAT